MWLLKADLVALAGSDPYGRALTALPADFYAAQGRTLTAAVAGLFADCYDVASQAGLQVKRPAGGGGGGRGGRGGRGGGLRPSWTTSWGTRGW